MIDLNKVENFFCGKKILFIAPKFFGYEREIKNRLESLGAQVDFYDDRPSNSAWSKFAIRVIPQTQQGKIKKYFSALLEKHSSGYDFIFIVKMECMPAEILVGLRKQNPEAKFIYYSYDSVKNNNNFKKSIELFDSAFTFDDEDAKAIAGIKLRPLFFLNEYRDLPIGNIKYDISFIGTAHSDRYLLLQKIKSAMPDESFCGFFFLFVPSKYIFWLKKIFVPVFWHSKKSDFSFLPMGKKDVLSVISQSSSILDFQHPNQTGLTMRTIEMLGARKKLITTNANVKRYDFYRKENIKIIDRENPIIESEFFHTPYVDLPEELYEKYSIDGWLREVFSIPDKN
ncbi:hypothetical protein ACIPF8_17965 [Collimonas sp. NPDC087041]|uniref:hypothetical protein n=1 Tax=Collimonas sp. NPDC087041 TaxID=3363960 RepID=UPI0037FFB26B